MVIGAPIYNHAEHLEQAVESVLAQTLADFRLLLIDDGSSDGTAELARSFADRDERVSVHVNERRLGMLRNTRRAFALARSRHPGAEFWALGSDHDVWEPAWLEKLVAALDVHENAVLAYPLTRRIDERGDMYPSAKPPWRFDTAGMADRRARMTAAFRGIAAGDMIYGLFRAAALERVGSYRAVLVPDRLLLSELALRGQFVQVPEVLWSRRFRGLAELDRQRRAFFPEGAPAYTHLPWWLTHAALMGWEYGVRGKGEPEIRRGEGAVLAVNYLRASLRHRAWRRARRTRGRVLRTRDAALGPPVRAALRSAAVRRWARRSALPFLAETESALKRLTHGRG